MVCQNPAVSLRQQLLVSVSKAERTTLLVQLPNSRFEEMGIFPAVFVATETSFLCLEVGSSPSEIVATKSFF